MVQQAPNTTLLLDALGPIGAVLSAEQRVRQAGSRPAQPTYFIFVNLPSLHMAEHITIYVSLMAFPVADPAAVSQCVLPVNMPSKECRHFPRAYLSLFAPSIDREVLDKT